MYIAHVRKSDGEEQFLKNHLLGTADLAEEIGNKIGLGKICRLAGLLHDLGKYSDEFQEYLREAVANPDAPPKRGSVNHSSAGGVFLFREMHGNEHPIGKFVAEIVGNAIVSHHSSVGLQDYITNDGSSDYFRRVSINQPELHVDLVIERFYQEVIKKESLDLLLEQSENELTKFIKTKTMDEEVEEKYQTLFYLTKFVYSALVDADRMNTIQFEEKQKINTEKPSFESYYNRLIKHLATFQPKENEELTQINRLRTEMSEECEEFSGRETGIYSLSIPTGGGKTLASLRFALKHCMKHQKERIIYIVPFTTIIEQNAATVKSVLEDEINIIEHHSNVVREETADVKKIDEEKSIQLTRDNWDAPIIFTTMVQYLNAFFSKGTRNIRRLHNLSNAVLIFDEVQSIPTKCLYMFNTTVNFLVKYGNTTSVLCTATQPALDQVKAHLNMSKNPEMIQNLSEVSRAFKRVDVHLVRKPGDFDLQDMTKFILNKSRIKKSILVVVNTKSAARKLYQEMLQISLDGIKLYHLSTGMCAEHRKEKLAKMREELQNGMSMICFTTQLIEAGVDISFECVIRSMAGLPSIAQAAGRCNRNGESKIQDVFVLTLSKSLENIKMKSLEEIYVGQAHAEKIFSSVNEEPEIYSDVLSDAAMRKYFAGYYKEFEGKLGYPVKEGDPLIMSMGTNKTVYDDFYDKTWYSAAPLLHFEPARIGKNFQVIDTVATEVLVPYDVTAKKLIADLNGELTDVKQMNFLLKKSQGYMVSVFEQDLAKLQENNLLFTLLNGEVLALEKRAYNDEFGLDTSGESDAEIMLY